MKVIHIILKVVLSVILVLPIGGLLGVFPEPTADLYNTTQAFDFITMLNVAIYISYTMAIVHVIALYSLWTRREALAALLILPITVNVIGFHAFLDGGLLTGGAILGNIMLLINLYFIWKSREKYQPLLSQSK